LTDKGICHFPNLLTIDKSRTTVLEPFIQPVIQGFTPHLLVGTPDGQVLPMFLRFVRAWHGMDREEVAFYDVFLFAFCTQQSL
jgi:hypothetical protein